MAADHVHLLRGRKIFSGCLVWFSWRGSLSANVVECIFVVHLEIGVLEFPGPRSIGRLPIFFIVVADFVEIIFIQLAHKTGKVAVLEVFG